MAQPLYLSDADIGALGITPPQMADAIEAALRDKTAGRLHVTPKSAILPGEGRYMMSTLSVGDGPGLTVLKAVTVAPGNPARDLPGILGAILVMDAQTGAPVAVMDAGWITAHRTAGLTAVAARRLAPKDARVVTFVGTGVQARSHLDAFAAMFPLAEVRALGRGRPNLMRLRDKATDMGLTFREADGPEDAVRGADLVVSSLTLNYDTTPFLDARLLKPGAFAAITDLGIPWLGTSWDAFGTVAVDDRQQEETAERPILPPQNIAADLAELVTGDPITPDPAKPSALAFRGIALGDFAATALVLETARAKGVA